MGFIVEVGVAVGVAVAIEVAVAAALAVAEAGLIVVLRTKIPPKALQVV